MKSFETLIKARADRAGRPPTRDELQQALDQYEQKYGNAAQTELNQYSADGSGSDESILDTAMGWFSDASASGPSSGEGQQEGTGLGSILDEAAQQADAGATPSWVSTAQGELGVAEIEGSEHNPRVLEYHATTGGFSDDETPWCASFVNWVMVNSGQAGTGSATAMSWADYGTQLDRPAYGAIGVISYGGGSGHVGFVVGINGDSIELLGGNQSNTVKISNYSVGQFVAFVVPSGYQVPESAYGVGSSGEHDSGGGLAETR